MPRTISSPRCDIAPRQDESFLGDLASALLRPRRRVATAHTTECGASTPTHSPNVCDGFLCTGSNRDSTPQYQRHSALAETVLPLRAAGRSPRQALCAFDTLNGVVGDARVPALAAVPLPSARSWLSTSPPTTPSPL